LGGSANAAGVAAATTTIISGLIRNPNMNAGEYAMLAAQAGIAAGSVVGGAAAATFLGTTTSYSALYGVLAINPIALVIGVVISVVLNSVISNMMGGIKLDATDSQTRNGAEDKLWRFAYIDTVGADGSTKKVDAVYAFNADGQTLNKAELMNRDSFRLMDGPVLGRGQFNPTHFIGSSKTATALGADNIVTDDADEVIMGNTELKLKTYNANDNSVTYKLQSVA
jgi:hypothetical protein